MITCYYPDGSKAVKPIADVKVGDIFRTDAQPEGPTFRATSEAYMKSARPGSWVYLICDAEEVGEAPEGYVFN